MNTTLIANLPKEDRVRANTNPEINERIDRDLEHRLRCYAVQDKQVLSERIEELDREWDVERLLEAQAATLTFLGTLLGITRSRRWLILPLVVSGFFLQHALQGWCPPLPLLRNLGVRTRLEIERERYALKWLRGDFDHLERGEEGVLRNADELIETLTS